MCFIYRLFATMLRITPRLNEATYDCLPSDHRQGMLRLEACYGPFC
jgi:hypothetical protein